MFLVVCSIYRAFVIFYVKKSTTIIDIFIFGAYFSHHDITYISSFFASHSPDKNAVFVRHTKLRFVKEAICNPCEARKAQEGYVRR